MRETFGMRINRFALTVDIVDENIFRQIWELIRQYLTIQLNPAYWALLIENEVDNSPGLLARECSAGNKPAFSLMANEGLYTGLASYSFKNRRPLWIVSPDKEQLDQKTQLRDCWSKMDDLPRFDKSKNDNIRTVILIPLAHKGRTIGVLDLQLSQYKEITAKIQNELKLVADSVSVLLMLSESNQSQREYTIEAIKMHANSLNSESWPLLTKPKIFFASSDNAEESVTGAIISVLDEFSDRLDINYWRDSSASGNINWEILRQIKESQFGICYFSEPADGSDQYTYRDNINVVFEAGMMQSQTNPTVTDHPVGWIPIREQQSPPPPFDFAQERMIIVERIQGGTPNLDKLRADLKNRISNLLE